MTSDIFIIFLLLLRCLTVNCGDNGIEMTCLDVPKVAYKGQDVTFKCCYDLSNYKLYSIKWYRDGKEFFRYIPSVNPPKEVLHIPGINVLEANSTGEEVVLQNVDLNSKGRYKCEVVSDWPGFHTADKSKEMIVVVVPKEKPEIEGTRNDYRIGDTARLTCVSAASIPAAELTWFINGEKAPRSYLVPQKSTKHMNGLEQTRLGLQFEVSRNHFKGGEMVLKCSAMIESIYYQTQEHGVDGQLIYSVPVMESRDLAAYNGCSSIMQSLQLVVAAVLMLTVIGHIQS